MKVRIKEFNIPMEVKTSGIEFEVRDTKGQFLGDLVLSSTRLVWCEGKTDPKHGKRISWEKFRQYMNSL